MKLRHSLAALLVSATLFGCATSSTPSVNVPLVATQRNAGQIGNVTLTSFENKTGLNFFISGAPMGVTLPLRLYTFVYKGSCQKPGPVAYSMNEQVNTERQPIRGWTLSRTAPVEMSVLLSGEYSILVRTAPSDGNVDIYCGDIKQGVATK
jgi:hypothetical protein